MSAASGSQIKEANRKYKKLNINDIYKGKTLDTASKTVIAKHGMQSLGKVGGVRRIAPASLPSLKAENCGNDPNVNLVPAGGQGWGNKGEETGSAGHPSDNSIGQENQKTNADGIIHTETNQITASSAEKPKPTIGQADAAQSTSNKTIGSNVAATSGSDATTGSKAFVNGGKVTSPLNLPSGIGLPGSPKPGGTGSVPWSNVSINQQVDSFPPQKHIQDGSPQEPSSVQQTPFFNREFPVLSSGSPHTESTSQYGPGPSLRPDTKGSWAMGGGVSGASSSQLQDDSFHPVSGGLNGDVGFGNKPNSMGQRGSPPAPGLNSGPILPAQFQRGGMIRGPMGPPGPMMPPFKVMGPPPPFRMRGPMMHNRPGFGPPPPFFRGGNRRPPGPMFPMDDAAIPPPIIKKEDLENFDPVPHESDAWANSAPEVDYNKKLNFSEDEASVEEDKSHWSKDKYKENFSIPKDRPVPQKLMELDTQPKDRWERNEIDEKSEEKSFMPDSLRWAQPQRNSYDRIPRDFSRKSTSPSVSFEDSIREKREINEVESALERARQLQQQEEKRYEEKKRFDLSKNDSRKGRDNDYAETASSSDTSAKERHNENNAYMEGKDGSRDYVPEANNQDRMRGAPRHPRSYNDRRDPGHREPYRDQYEMRPHDRRDQYSYRNKIAPRFQKQQEMQRSSGSYRSSTQPPSLFDSRYTNPMNRSSNREEARSGWVAGDDSNFSNHDATEDYSSNRPWNGSWANSEEQWNSQHYDRRENNNEKDREGRNYSSAGKRDHDNRKTDNWTGLEDKPKKYEGSKLRNDSWGESESTSDWRNNSASSGPPRSNSHKDEERPQRPESRDSRTSRDSAGSYTQREKKLEITSWADSTAEFEDYYRSDIREESFKESSFAKEKFDSLDGHNNIEALDTQKEGFKSGMAPAPITKERLEASETQKEVRKNMTTLRRSYTSQDSPKQALDSDSVSQIESTSDSTNSKNGDRSRPVLSTTVDSCVNYASLKSNKNSSDKNFGNSTSTTTSSAANVKKEVENVWKQKGRENVYRSETSPEFTNQESSGERSTREKNHLHGSSRNQQESSKFSLDKAQTTSASNTLNVGPDSKKVGVTTTTSAQESSSISNDVTEGTNGAKSYNSDKAGKEKNLQKDKSQASQKSSKGMFRHDDSRNRGSRNPRMPDNSYSLYRGRSGTGRNLDYGRRGGFRNDTHPSRMQGQGYQDYYYYNYPMKENIRTDRYGNWGRLDSRRPRRNHMPKPLSTNIADVPSLMDAEVRKPPNLRNDRVPPRFQRKREQEMQNLKKEKYRTSSRNPSGNQNVNKTLKNGVPPTRNKENNNIELVEDADWETASESSDHERHRERNKMKRKSTRPDKYQGGSLTKSNNDFGEHRDNRYVSRPSDSRKTTSPSKQEKSKQVSSYLLPNQDSNTMDTLEKIKTDNKSNQLEGIDLNNFASVVVIDNQPQVSEMVEDVSDTNAGFQEVTRKKGGRDKSRVLEEECSSPPSFADGSSHKRKDKKKHKNGNFERSRQAKLAPRFAKKDNNRNFGNSTAIGHLTNESNFVPPPPKNAWDKPLTSALRTNSPHLSVQDKSNSIGDAVQENHDSGVEVSDPPNSTGSSQRSSPSDNPVFSRQDKVVPNVIAAQDKSISSSILNFPCVDKNVLDGSSVPSQTIIFENTNYKAAGAVTVGAEFKAKFGSDISKSLKQTRERKLNGGESVGKEDSEQLKPEPIQLPLGFKADENAADMKLDFTFDRDLAELGSDKTNRSTVRSLALTSPSSPSTHDLNVKIASVKKVWDAMTPLVEHSEDPATSTFSQASYSNVESISNLDHSAGLDTFACKDTVGAEETSNDLSYQTGAMQQVSVMNVSSIDYAASLAKSDVNRVGAACKTKPDQEAISGVTLVSQTTGTSISPPLPSIGQSSSMYLGGTAAFGGVGGAAIPSPPTVMFNSSQQLQQTGLFQPLFDGTTVLGQRGASQFSQYTYGIGQGINNSAAAFGQQSMFLQTPPPSLSAPADLYSNNLSQYRLQTNAMAGFGQNQPQPQNQNTVLISSASSTLMSSAVKPSNHTFGSSQQNFGTIGSKTGTHFQQSGLGGSLQGSALQGAPQPSVYIFDTNPSMGLLNSPLVQRPGVQSSVIQAIQTPNSFYSNNAAATPGGPPTAPPGAPAQQAAAGYYAASGSPLQAVQQQAQSTLQTQPFGIQNFGSQSGPTAMELQNFSSGLNLSAQQQMAAQAYRNNQPGLQTNFLKSLQHPTNLQGSVSDGSRQHIKSPGLSQNSFSSSYFPTSSGSQGVSMTNVNPNVTATPNHAPNNMAMNVSMNGVTGQVMSALSSPKSQSRKMPGICPPSMNANSHRPISVGSYTQQNSGQVTNVGGLRSNMVIGMRNPMTMSAHNPLPGGCGGFNTGPGPIQRPSQQATSFNSIMPRTNRHNPPSGPPMASGGPPHRPSNPSSAQQAKLRADALNATQVFFGRDGQNSSSKCDKNEGKASPIAASTDDHKSADPETSQTEISAK